jgi:hypothetical protein
MYNKSIINGNVLLAAENIGFVGPVFPVVPETAGLVSTVLLSATLLKLQAVNPTVLAAIARLRRVFFSIRFLPIFIVMIVVYELKMASLAHF